MCAKLLEIELNLTSQLGMECAVEDSNDVIIFADCIQCGLCSVEVWGIKTVGT